MIGGLLTIFVACWVYQGAVSKKRDGIVKLVMIGAGLFYVVQMLWLGLDILFFVSDDDVDLTNEVGGRIQAIYRELMPSIVGFLTAAVYRTKIVMHDKLSFANLFSGLNIFKTSGDSSSEAASAAPASDASAEVTKSEDTDSES